MKKFLLIAITVTVLMNFILPLEKVIAEGRVCYWICGTCGMKTKTLKGYVPDPVRKGGTFHIHEWKEVDYQTWIEW